MLIRWCWFLLGIHKNTVRLSPSEEHICLGFVSCVLFPVCICIDWMSHLLFFCISGSCLCRCSLWKKVLSIQIHKIHNWSKRKHGSWWWPKGFCPPLLSCVCAGVFVDFSSGCRNKTQTEEACNAQKCLEIAALGSSLRWDLNADDFYFCFYFNPHTDYRCVFHQTPFWLLNLGYWLCFMVTWLFTDNGGGACRWHRREARLHLRLRDGPRRTCSCRTLRVGQGESIKKASQ